MDTNDPSEAAVVEAAEYLARSRHRLARLQRAVAADHPMLLEEQRISAERFTKLVATISAVDYRPDRAELLDRLARATPAINDFEFSYEALHRITIAVIIEALGT